MKQVLIILASLDKETCRRCVNGGGLDEFTIPYYLFRKAGYAVFVAAPHCAGRTLDLELLRGNAPEYLQECWKDGFDPALARLSRSNRLRTGSSTRCSTRAAAAVPGNGSRPTPATRGCSAACSTPGRWSAPSPTALLRCSGEPAATGIRSCSGAA